MDNFGICNTQVVPKDHYNLHVPSNNQYFKIFVVRPSVHDGCGCGRNKIAARVHKFSRDTSSICEQPRGYYHVILPSFASNLVAYIPVL